MRHTNCKNIKLEIKTNLVVYGNAHGKGIFFRNSIPHGDVYCIHGCYQRDLHEFDVQNRLFGVRV